ncbi:unnamed protein product [Rhodiola kirilowii]
MSASVMVEEGNNPAKIDGSCTPATVAAPPPRRPRVREVSSRFMSPFVSVSSSTLSGDSDKSPLHKHLVRPSSTPRRRNQQDAEVLGTGDENRLDTGRSLDNPFKVGSGTPMGSKKPQRAAVKLFKENNEGRADQKNSGSDGNLSLRSSGGIEVASKFMAPKRRPDTPVVSTSFDKMQQNRLYRSGSDGSATPAAARQLQLGGMPSSAHSSPKAVVDDTDRGSQQLSSRDSISSDTSSVDSNSCTSSPIRLQKCRTPRPMLDQVRSSMPESCASITVSSRYLGDRTGSRGVNGSSIKMSASPCCRSLNMSVFNGIQHGLSNVNNLPPHPPSARVAADSKLKKVNTQQESIHSLRLLHNRFLQWRFSNAKAEAAMVAQTQAAERMLYSLSIKISDLRESVMRRQIELGLLRRSKILFSILESQMPDLDIWSTFEEEFVTSLSEITNALLNASVQLPTSGNIKADVKVFREALSSALKVMEMIESQISSFMPKAAEMDKLLSELARVHSAERNYIEESGDLLSKANMLQVDECSSVAQLIQLKQRRLG